MHCLNAKPKSHIINGKYICIWKTYLHKIIYLCRTYSIFKVALDYDLNSFFSSNLNQIQTWVKFEKGLLFVYWFENLHIPSYFGSQIQLKPSLGYYFLIIAFILHINSKFSNQPMLKVINLKNLYFCRFLKAISQNTTVPF